MKIAVSARGPGMEDDVDPRFGRAAWFQVIDTESMKSEAKQNENASAGGGAGIQAGQNVAETGAEVVLTGNCGPNAYRTLEAAGVKVVTGVSGTVRKAVEEYVAGDLKSSNGPSVESHFGS